MQGHVVIGTGYGDEGKGLMTDYFCSLYNSNKVLNVKVNGGCQAGHTACVLDKENKRYNLNVFHTLGAGTLRGVTTYLASKFILNIEELGKEMDKFYKDFGWIPHVLIDEDCRIQFKVDEELNRLIENTRHEKHGTCGKGVYETVNRCHHGEILRFDEVYNMFLNNKDKGLEESITKLSKGYIEYRKQFLLETENLDIDTTQLMMDLPKLSKYTVQQIWGVLEGYKEYIHISYFDGVLKYGEYDGIVFECSQGLELNWGDKRNTPHTTASHTGLTNVIKELNRSNNRNMIEDIEVCYVTRSYKTKHGDGEFLEQDDNVAQDWQLYDRTNQYNKFQGTLKFGRIDKERLVNLIESDFEQTKEVIGETKFKKSLAVTHLDQTNEAILTTCGEEIFTKFNAQNVIKGDKTYYAFGEKASDIIEYY